METFYKSIFTKMRKNCNNYRELVASVFPSLLYYCRLYVECVSKNDVIMFLLSC